MIRTSHKHQVILEVNIKRLRPEEFRQTNGAPCMEGLSRGLVRLLLTVTLVGITKKPLSLIGTKTTYKLKVHRNLSIQVESKNPPPFREKTAT